MSKQIHYVKIVDGKVSFECQDVTAKCHTYPVCDCESWGEDHNSENGAGHELGHHVVCWMQGWFDAEGAVYIGDDAEDWEDNHIPRDMNREGFVTVSFEDEWIEFEFAEVTP